jgi:hypothetical protein
MVPLIENSWVLFWFSGVVSTVSAGKGVRPMTSTFPVPGTMNWEMAVYANCGAPPVKNGAEEATFFWRKR